MSAASLAVRDLYPGDPPVKSVTLSTMAEIMTGKFAEGEQGYGGFPGGHSDDPIYLVRFGPGATDPAGARPPSVVILVNATTGANSGRSFAEAPR